MVMTSRYLLGTYSSRIVPANLIADIIASVVKFTIAIEMNNYTYYLLIIGVREYLADYCAS